MAVLLFLVACSQEITTQQPIINHSEEIASESQVNLVPELNNSEDDLLSGINITYYSYINNSSVCGAEMQTLVERYDSVVGTDNYELQAEIANEVLSKQAECMVLTRTIRYYIQDNKERLLELGEDPYDTLAQIDGVESNLQDVKDFMNEALDSINSI